MILVNGKVVKFTNFSDGSSTCLVHEEDDGAYSVFVRPRHVTIDLVEIGLVKDAIDRMNPTNVVLFLSYFPQARADRVFAHGMPLPVAVFAKIINSYGFNQVFIDDPHSYVTPAILDNVQVSHMAACVRGSVPWNIRRISVVVSPDAGAMKKTFEVAREYGSDLVQASKHRDLKTGDITGCSFPEVDLTGRSVLICDDICDGGATFMYLEREIRKANPDKVYLYVTHGIFSKGLDPLSSFDGVYCYNHVCDYVTEGELKRFNEERKV